MLSIPSISGEAIDLDSFCGNIISECEKTEETLMNTWFKEISAIFVQSKNVVTTTNTPIAGGILLKLKGERLLRFYQCASSLLSIQVIYLSSIEISIINNYSIKLRDLLTRSIMSYVDIFSDRRKLPRIEMELILSNQNKIAFSPAIEEVSEMILSVVSEVRH